MRTRFFAALAAVLLSAFAMPALAVNAPSVQPEIRVGILLFDGVQIIDFAGPYEVFGTAGFGVVTVSHDAAPVTTAMGLKVVPDTSFEDAPPFDVLLVPGGDVGEAEHDPDIRAFVQARVRSSLMALSVCTGAFILAGGGLLDGLEATTFTPRIGELARRYPAVQVVKDVRWTDNGQVITSAGLSSGIDAALHLVERLRGAEQARSVALRLEYDWQPDGGFIRSRMADRYLSIAALQEAVDWPEDIAVSEQFSVGDEQQWRMRFHINSPTPAEELVRRIGRGLDSLPAWTRQASLDRWDSHQENRRVALGVTATPGTDPREYQLDFELAAPID